MKTPKLTETVYWHFGLSFLRTASTRCTGMDCPSSRRTGRKRPSEPLGSHQPHRSAHSVQRHPPFCTLRITYVSLHFNEGFSSYDTAVAFSFQRTLVRPGSTAPPVTKSSDSSPGARYVSL